MRASRRSPSSDAARSSAPSERRDSWVAFWLSSELLSSLRLQIEGRGHRGVEEKTATGCIRKRVVEGGRRISAVHVDTERRLATLVEDADQEAVCGLAPVQGDHEPLALPDG